MMQQIQAQEKRDSSPKNKYGRNVCTAELASTVHVHRALYIPQCYKYLEPPVYPHYLVLSDTGAGAKC